MGHDETKIRAVFSAHERAIGDTMVARGEAERIETRDLPRKIRSAPGIPKSRRPFGARSSRDRAFYGLVLDTPEKARAFDDAVAARRRAFAAAGSA